MAKRFFAAVLGALLLLTCLAGCGAGAGFEDVLSTVDGISTVIISPGYAWYDKTDAERQELAQRGVDEAVTAYEKQQSDKEYGYLYEQDLHTVIGRYNGKTVFFYNADTVPNVTIDESTIVASVPQTNAIQYISDIWCFGVENGVAYFDVFISPSVDWNTSTEQEQIIENVMAYCQTYADNENAVRFEVVCVDEDTQKAFVYKDGNTVQVYLLGTDQHRDYTLAN